MCKKKKVNISKIQPLTSPKKHGHPIIRNFRSMYTIANMLDLKDLSKFS